MIDNNISRDVNEARLPGDPGERAAARLALEGTAAVLPVIEALSHGPPDLTWRLSRVLARIRDAEALPLLAQFIDDSKSSVSLAAIRAIGRSRSPDALGVLRKALRTSFRKERLVEAIGELRDPTGIEVLRDQLAELNLAVDKPHRLEPLVRLVEQSRQDSDTSSLSLMLELATALAKLGDHSLVFAAIHLANYGVDDVDDGDALLVRIAAVQALSIVTGKGVFAALVRALEDSSREVRGIAMRGMLLLGASQVVDVWIAVLRRWGEPQASLAYSLIHDVVGEWPESRELVEEIDPDELETWWQQRRSSFTPNTCHRNGRPAWPPDLMTLIGRPGIASPIEDLRITTGVDFELDAPPALLAAGDPDAMLSGAREWWSLHGSRFQAGRLYKYGHELSLQEALSPDDPESPG